MQPRGQSVNSPNLELFSAFIKHTPAAIAMLDCNWRYLLTSQRWLTDYAPHNPDLSGCHCEVFPLSQQEEWELRTRQPEKEFRENTSPASADQERAIAPLAHYAPRRWQEIYALCLAGEAQRGDSDYVIRPDGSLQRIKWEIQPWHTSTGEIGGVMIFTEFQAETSGSENSQNYHYIREKSLEKIWRTASLTTILEQLQQEIAQRKQTQSLQQASEQRYREMIAAMAEGVILQDVNPDICTCNASAERILGLSADQLLGRSAIDCRWRVIKENGELFSSEEHPLNVTMRTGQALSDAIVGIHKPDGTLTWVNINSQPLFLPNETTPYAAVTSLRDITKRKQIEAALLKSEERFRATFEQAAVGITHASIDGRFIRVNQKFGEIVGYDREELLEKTFYDITHPDDLGIDLEYVRSLTAGEIETYTLEKRYLHASGQSIWAEITATLVQPPQGAPKYFLCVIQDITTRKAAECALRQSEAQLRELFARESLLNRLSTQIRNSLELNTILETTVQEIRQMLQIDRCQFAWYRPDDSSAYWEVVQEARNPELPDFKGCYGVEVVGLLVQRLGNLEILQIDDINAIDDPIFQEFVRSIGYTSVLVMPMQTPSGTIGVISCLQAGSARPWMTGEVELLQAVKDQLLIAIKQAELYAESRKATGQAKAQATQLEQTLYELQRTQAQLIQIEKMSSLGQLVAGVAHEINNPVNFIYGNLLYTQEYSQDLLSLVQLYRAAYPTPPAVIKERIDMIDLDFLITDFVKLQDSMKVGAERIREIVRSLRTFSRLDESDSKQVDIHTGIESTLMILQHRLKGKAGYPAINLVKEYGDLPQVECFAGQLNQVFMNLLTNALDAIDEKMSKMDQFQLAAYPLPTLTISTGIVETDNSSPLLFGMDSDDFKAFTQIPKYVFIRIADNGMGMTQNTQQQLFNPFFTTKPIGRGTGLGLAISYQIVVEKHRGQLRCNSTPGQGSEFVVEIPIKQ